MISFLKETIQKSNKRFKTKNFQKPKASQPSYTYWLGSGTDQDYHQAQYEQLHTCAVIAELCQIQLSWARYWELWKLVDCNLCSLWYWYLGSAILIFEGRGIFAIGFVVIPLQFHKYFFRFLDDSTYAEIRRSTNECNSDLNVLNFCYVTLCSFLLLYKIKLFWI